MYIVCLLIDEIDFELMVVYSEKEELIEKLSNSTLTVAIGPITGKILDEYNIKHIYPERYTVKDMIDLMFRELNNQG